MYLEVKGAKPYELRLNLRVTVLPARILVNGVMMLIISLVE